MTAYADHAKQQLLGVSAKTLEVFGAVSHECAVEMARGLRQKLQADIAVAITGIAGPLGGTPEKPVGLVYVAVSSALGEEVLKLNLARGRADDRETIRYASSSHAMSLVLKTAKKLKG